MTDFYSQNRCVCSTRSHGPLLCAFCLSFHFNAKEAGTLFAISNDVSYYALCNIHWEEECGCYYNSCKVLALGVADIHWPLVLDDEAPSIERSDECYVFDIGRPLADTSSLGVAPSGEWMSDIYDNKI